MYLVSIGTATPPHALTMEDRHQVAEMFVTGDERDRWFAPYIFEKTTVERRHSVLLNSSEGDLRERQSFFQTTEDNDEQLGPTTAERLQMYEKHATSLAKQACNAAFESSGFDPSDITHLVTASCTGLSSPGVDLDLIRELPLSADVERTNLGFMGCHAGLNCLRVAHSFTKANPQACVLVSATELCGLHYQYRGANDQKIANALFADGSGAALVVGEGWKSRLPASCWKISGTGAHVVSDTADYMTWKVGDNGFAMSLSEKIPETIEAKVPAWMQQWLEKYSLTPAEIKYWAVHPGGPQILNAFEAAMALEETDLKVSRDILQNNGNMSSATIFFVLQQKLQQPEAVPCVAIGFGPGLAIEALLLES